MNIDKDIETIKDFIEYSQNMINDMEYERPVDVTIDKNEIQAIENVLSELETYKKIAEKLAYEFSLTIHVNIVCGTLDASKKRCANKDISCQQCVLDWARNKVNKDD